MKPPDIFTHKKFQVGISTFLLLFFTHLVPVLQKSSTFASALELITVEQWFLIIAPLLVAIGAQGWADNGKEATKIIIDGKEKERKEAAEIINGGKE